VKTSHRNSGPRSPNASKFAFVVGILHLGPLRAAFHNLRQQANSLRNEIARSASAIGLLFETVQKCVLTMRRRGKVDRLG
jgi:hypothetical protein